MPTETFALVPANTLPGLVAGSSGAGNPSGVFPTLFGYLGLSDDRILQLNVEGKYIGLELENIRKASVGLVTAWRVQFEAGAAYNGGATSVGVAVQIVVDGQTAASTNQVIPDTNQFDGNLYDITLSGLTMTNLEFNRAHLRLKMFDDGAFSIVGVDHVQSVEVTYNAVTKGEKVIPTISHSEKTIDAVACTEKVIEIPQVTVDTSLEVRPLTADLSPLEWPFAPANHFDGYQDDDGLIGVSSTTVGPVRDRIQFSMPSGATLLKGLRMKVTFQAAFVLPGSRTRYRLQYRLNGVNEAPGGGYTSAWFTVAHGGWQVETIDWFGLNLAIVPGDEHAFQIACDIEGVVALFQVDQVEVRANYSSTVDAAKSEKVIASVSHTEKVVATGTHTEKEI